jgi:putative FmdB family regulatory protein
MPIYEYECEMCHSHIELHQPVKEHEAPVVCPSCNCEHTMKRVYSASPVIFRGNGFYSTDSQDSNGNSKKE